MPYYAQLLSSHNMLKMYERKFCVKFSVDWEYSLQGITYFIFWKFGFNLPIKPHWWVFKP